MPYTQITLGQFVSQISSVMDDTGAMYWTVDEIVSTTYECLRVWGAYTNYWRARGDLEFSSATAPYYDLATYLPTLRTRTWTLDQMVKDIQSMLLENPSGIVGTDMSGQVTVGSILNAIQTIRNQFVLDVCFPLTQHSVVASPPPPNGLIEFGESSVFVHRAMWKDTYSGIWQNLWRQDEWAVDHGNTLWTIEPGNPQEYSEACLAPLQLQMMPPPANTGELETLAVDSLQMDTTDPNATFGIPDEWIHAVKYGALSYLLYGEGQIKDVLRAQYAEQRYQQAVQMAKSARSIIRLLVNGTPLAIDTLYNMDAGNPYWRNQTTAPVSAAVLYDMVVINPGLQTLGATADVVRSAPLPGMTEYLQIGSELIPSFTDYVTHVLVFKCGGNEFKSSLPGYDAFMSEVSSQKGVNAAKIQYLTALFGQPQAEWSQRPDRRMVNA